jgi:hypothetical protein
MRPELWGGTDKVHIWYFVSRGPCAQTLTGGSHGKRQESQHCKTRSYRRNEGPGTGHPEPKGQDIVEPKGQDIVVEEAWNAEPKTVKKACSCMSRMSTLSQNGYGTRLPFF